MRADPRLVAAAVESRKEGSKKREALEDFSEILKELSGFLELTKEDIFNAKRQALAGNMEPETMCASLGLQSSVHFVKYSSEKENLVHVLNDPCSCAVWRRFCEYASVDASSMTTLFFTLKGGIKMVITNAPVRIPPGQIYHAIKSGAPDIPDVYIFGIDKVHLFMYQQFMKG